jgi:hypothetical protein
VAPTAPVKMIFPLGAERVTLRVLSVSPFKVLENVILPPLVKVELEEVSRTTATGNVKDPLATVISLPRKMLPVELNVMALDTSLPLRNRFPPVMDKDANSLAAKVPMEESVMDPAPAFKITVLKLPDTASKGGRESVPPPVLIVTFVPLASCIDEPLKEMASFVLVNVVNAPAERFMAGAAYVCALALYVDPLKVSEVMPVIFVAPLTPAAIPPMLPNAISSPVIVSVLKAAVPPTVPEKLTSPVPPETVNACAPLIVVKVMLPLPDPESRTDPAVRVIGEAKEIG